ncbi:MAG: hypothetical protein ACI9DF_005959, partial [Verrucomicrobiales bacterium]
AFNSSCNALKLTNAAPAAKRTPRAPPKSL